MIKPGTLCKKILEISYSEERGFHRETADEILMYVGSKQAFKFRSITNREDEYLHTFLNSKGKKIEIRSYQPIDLWAIMNLEIMSEDEPQND